MDRYLLALKALGELDREEPGEKFTTARIAKRAGAEDWTAGAWTKPWREALYALMMGDLVGTPTGRPHRWQLTRLGREKVTR